MSFVPAVRDYIELINNLYDSTSTDPNIEIIIRNTIIYLFETIRYFVFYLLSFQWFRDLCYLPIITPQISLSLIKEKIFLHDPLTPFLTFLETPAFSNNRFLIGFSNSFFACLPISCSSLICIYRLMINGVPSALFSLLGNILGQSCFLICVLFGLRSFIVPWFSLEPLNYGIGLYIVLNIIFQSLQKRSWKQIQFSEKNKLFLIFLTHFLLIWTEQPSIYQHIGNLTISSDSTILETLTSNGDINFFISHSFYLFGFIVGSLIFSVSFGIGILKLRSFLLNKFNIRYSVWLTRFHTISILWITTLTFASMPYYGFDYLFTNCFGFVSYDTALEKTIFHASSFRENLLQENTSDNEGLAEKRTGSLADFSSFDKSYYLVSRKPVLPDDPALSIDTFEDLNYQGEYAWTSRDRRRKRYQRKPFLSQSSTTGTRDDDIKKLSFSGREKETENRFSFFSSQNSSRKTDKQSGYPLQKVQSTDQQNKNISSDHDILKSQETELKILQLLSPFSLQNDWLNNVSNRQNEEKEKINQNKEKNGFANYERKLKGEALGSKDLFDYRNEDNSLSKFLYETSGYSFLPSPSVTLGNSMTKQEERAKNSFYTNPLYRFLLEKDVDAFLSRQPKDHFLSVFEEKQLSQNRSVLNDYYNTLRSYRLLPSWDGFQDEFNGSLSYANKIYNQQFKGTLSLVRRLFSITVNPLETESLHFVPQNGPKSGDFLEAKNFFDKRITNDRILKLDQPLYKTYIGNSSYLLDLKNNKKGPLKEKEEAFNQNERYFSDENLQDKRNWDKSENLPNLLMHEEAQNKGYKVENLNQKSKKSNGDQTAIVHKTNPLLSENFSSSDKKQTLSFPLIESTNPAPFYIGWDEKSRKLVITNRLLFSLNQETPFLTEPFNKEVLVSNKKQSNSKFLQNKNQAETKTKDIKFTAWPIPKSMLKNTKKEGLKSSLPYLPYKVLFDLLETPENGKAFEETLNDQMDDLERVKKEKEKRKEIPANLQFYPNELSFHKVLSPNRGGFIWPGSNSSLSH